MLFRCTELMRKQKTGVYEIDAAVEILGEGQQFVASGIHPDTGKKYVCPGDNLTDIAPEKLTEVTPDDIQRFLTCASSILSTQGDTVRPMRSGRTAARLPADRAAWRIDAPTRSQDGAGPGL